MAEHGRLIDADALMKQINNYVFTADMTTTLAVDMACRWIENAPTIEPEPQWIPVGEMLPENKQEVLVTEYGETDIGRRFEGRWVDRYGDKMKDVTAWMPLPEPWRGEKHES